MNTETSDINDETPNGWIFFDAECRLCAAGRRRWGRIFERRGFVWVPLQTPGAAERLGATPDQLMGEMWVLPADAAPLRGISAWIALMTHVWWLKPLALGLRLRGVRPLAQILYLWVARHRYCFAGRCRISPGGSGKNRHSAFLELP